MAFLLFSALSTGCINEDTALGLYDAKGAAGNADADVALMAADGDDAQVAAVDADSVVEVEVDVAADAELDSGPDAVPDSVPDTVPDAVIDSAPDVVADSDTSPDTDTAVDIAPPCTPSQCDDGNPCTKETCDLAGACTHTNNDGVGCDDGDQCTGGDNCQGGKCAGGAATSCDDGNACTADSCYAKTGCEHLPAAGPCTDSNLCTVGDVCSGGLCLPGAATTCDDANPCTADACDPKQGCANLPSAGTCTDGDACTSPDTCVGGACQPGAAVSCDDKNLCTDDSCDKAKGCVNAANAATCSDGDACTSGDGCVAETCKPGAAVKCDDSNVCTDDSCDNAKGCVNLANAATCNDGDACSVGDSCKAKACVPGAGADCDDKNPCTDDSCEKAKGCVNAANAATCSDGDACTGGDLCAAGACKAGAAVKCDDGNVCTDDSCDKAKGCATAPNSATCAGGSCAGGKCVASGCNLWTGTIDMPVQSGVNGLIPLPDGGAIATGATITTPGDCFAQRMTAAGKKVWATTWTCNAASDIHGALVPGENAVWVASGDVPTKASVGLLTAVALDDGKIVWQRKAPATANFLGVAAHPGGGGVAAGDKGLVVRTDGKFATVDAGNAVWWNQDNQVGTWMTIALDAGGNAYVGGTTQHVPDGKCALRRIDPSGKTVWTTIFTQFSCVDLLGVAFLPDGGAVGVGNGWASPDYWVIRVSATNSLVSYKKFPASLSPFSRLNQVTVAGDDALVITGGAVWGNSSAAVWTNFSGEPYSIKTWTIEPYYFAGLANYGPAGLLLGGNSKGGLVRTDAFGNDTCASSGPCMGKSLADCADTNPCTADLCDAAHNGCYHTNLADGAACADSASCQIQQTCLAGKCQGGKDKLWNSTAGDGGDQPGGLAAALPDGGAIAVGMTGEFTSNFPAQLHRFDAAGKLLWTKTYPNGAWGTEANVVALADGYAFCGSTSAKGAGGLDFWLLRTDLDGNKLWDKTFGSPQDDGAKFVTAFPEGGFALVGGAHCCSNPDAQLIITSATGDALLNQTYGGSKQDGFRTVRRMANGGYLVGGLTDSTDLPGAPGNNGGIDFWLVAVDAAGKLQWNITAGGPAEDNVNDVWPMPNGDSYVVGHTYSAQLSDGTKSHGGVDGWLALVDASGKIKWSKLLGGSGDDFLLNLAVDATGLMLAGSTSSLDLPQGVKSAGSSDAWLVRTDLSGNIQWNRTIGGTGTDGVSTVAISSGGFVLGGSTNSNDLPGGKSTAGGYDNWVLHTDAWGNVTCAGAGPCATKPVTDCDDKNPCTADLCDAAHNGCYHTNLADGTACTDAASCQIQQTCLAGKCQGGKDKLYSSTAISGLTILYSAAPLPDGGFLVSGSAGNGGWGVKRLDSAGALVWEKAGSISASDPGRRAALATDGTVWQVGRAGSGGRVTKLNFATGAVLAEQTFGSGNGALVGLAPVANGAVVVVGNNGQGPWAAKLDGNLAVTWEASIPATDKTNHALRDVVALPDGQFVVTGTLGKPLVAKLDSAGKIVWQQTYANSGSTEFYKLAAMPDGGFVAVAQTVARLDGAGNMLWEKPAPGVFMYGVAARADGSFAAAGSKDGGTKSVLAAFDATGMPGPITTWTGSGNNEAISVAIAPDGGFAVAGIRNSTAWFARTDAFGHDTCGTAGLCTALTPSDCADTNPCTLDSCDGKAGCTHAVAPDGTACTNGTCSAGTCKPMAPAGMALIPAGPFKMGCVPGDTACAPDESPQHTVTLSAYYIDKTEVTAAAYKKCVDAGKCSVPANCSAQYATYGVSGKDQHPVNCVNWAQADSYCKWTDPLGRLPTEAEWEKAARGGLDDKVYPWGDEAPTCTSGLKNSALFSAGGVGCGKNSTVAVGTFGTANGYGLFDMLGSVNEMVADWYASGFYSTPAASLYDAVNTTKGANHVGRGCSVNSEQLNVRTSYRFYLDPGLAEFQTGFRCARPAK